MRKIIKQDWGYEVILANEPWTLVTEMDFEIGKEMVATGHFEQLFIINKGMFRFNISGVDYEFGYGKTILIKTNIKCFIHALADGQIVRVAQTSLREDLSGGSRK